MTFFPLPGTYAVVEIDVAKTLQSLNDPSANTAATGMKTTKCIVYLDVVLNLPLPDDDTFKYMVYIVGPGLRPADPERFLLPDMCAPIYPNTYHPLGDREPLKPRTPFPFTNCYHWFGPDMLFDLRIWNDGREYTSEERLSLPPDQQVKMERFRGKDMGRSLDAQRAPAIAASSGAGTSPKAEMLQNLDASQAITKALSSAPDVNSPSLPPTPASQDGPSVAAARPDYCESDYDSDASSYAPSERSHRSTENMAEMDVFGLEYDEMEELLPIVKIWPDVGAQLKEEDVPNPEEFIKQYNEIVRILKESKARALRAAKRMQRPPRAEYPEESSGDPLDYGKRVRSARGFWARLARVFSSILCLH